MTARPIPKRHWRSYGNDPRPSPAEAMDEPFNAFPSWFLRIECDRCGKVQMVNQVHSAQAYMAIRAILAKMRHDGCGGLAGKAELLSGIEDVSSRPRAPSPPDRPPVPPGRAQRAGEGLPPGFSGQGAIGSSGERQVSAGDCGRQDIHSGKFKFS